METLGLIGKIVDQVHGTEDGGEKAKLNQEAQPLLGELDAAAPNYSGSAYIHEQVRNLRTYLAVIAGVQEAERNDLAQNYRWANGCIRVLSGGLGFNRPKGEGSQTD